MWNTRLIIFYQFTSIFDIHLLKKKKKISVLLSFHLLYVMELEINQQTFVQFIAETTKLFINYVRSL